MVEKEENWERLSDQNCSFTMRVMVGAIILYDHIDSTGAFCKESPIDIRSVVELIKTQSRNEEVHIFSFTKETLAANLKSSLISYAMKILFM